MRRQHRSCRTYGLLLLVPLVVSSPASADPMFSFGLTGSNPRGDFATGWSEGAGFETGIQWTYWKSIDASVGLSFLDHQPIEAGDPEVLLGVWTLGVHWTPQLTASAKLDFMFGAQHHTALFHDGWSKYVGNKGYNESDLGACFGIALDRRLSDRWRIRLGVKTNTIFTEPEWVRYETVSVGLVHGCSFPKRKPARFSSGHYSSPPHLQLMTVASSGPIYREILPFAIAQPHAGALDFNPPLERHYFNTADWTVGFRGIFPQISSPHRIRWYSLPVRLSAPLAQTPLVLPLMSPRRREVGMMPDAELRMSPRPIDWRTREFAVTVGDEAGDAMMLEFVDPEDSVGNRGSLLGLEMAVADVIGRQVNWWVRGGYRKDDWLAYRRHAVRTPIAPVEEGRENVGADEEVAFSGGIRWVPRADFSAESDVAAKHFPALWVRDRMTFRTTKWSGESAVALARTDLTLGARSLGLQIGFTGTRTENAHIDPSRDVRFGSGALSLTASSHIRPVPNFLFVRFRVTGLVERLKMSAFGDLPSHGYDGPSSRTMWRISAEPALRRGGQSARFTLGAEVWDDHSALPGVDLEWKRRFGHGGGLRFSAGHSRRVPDLFQEHGWSNVVHQDIPAGEIRFAGGDLDAEGFDHVEMAVDYSRGRTNQYGHPIGLSCVALAIYHERVRDFIVAADEEWHRLGSNLEWVRSGRWVNGGTVTSTGADLSFGTETGQGGFRAYIYLRDVQWEADRSDVARPTLGGKWGAGMLAGLRLPKKTEFLLRLHSADPPRFATYGGWTEGTGIDRLRVDAALETVLGEHWHATITALDVLDDGHVEVPGGNAVGFRVAGELRYSWSRGRE